MSLGSGLTDINVTRVTFPVSSNSTIAYDRTLDGGSAQKGLCVHLSANKTVNLCAAGERIIGVIEAVEEDPSGTNVATVAIGGMVTVKAGTAGLTVAKSIMGGVLGAAEGYAVDVAAATLAEVAQGRGTVVDATTSTAVLVWL